MVNQTLYFGLKFYEILTLIGVVIGPITAVLITLWVDGRRRDREQKIVVFRHLLATRHLPADPGFLVAINLIPTEFNSDPDVMTAHNDFIESTRSRLDGVNDAAIIVATSTKLTRLVFSVAKNLGFKLRETDIQTTAYASDGWIKRDQLLQDSQQAMLDVANILWMQTRLLAGESWDQVKGSQSPSAITNDPKPRASKKK